MADVAKMSLGDQLALMAWLRWKLFRNSLRKKSAKLDLLAYVLASLFGLVFVFGIGMGMGFGAYFFTSQGQFAQFSLLLWAVFAIWQFMPLMTATSASGFDFRNLLRFPLRFSAFYLLSLAFGIADPGVAAALVWLLCITVGIAAARLDLVLPAILLFIVFAAANLMLSRMLFAWLERVLARRRTREALFVVFMLAMLGAQFSGIIVERWGRQAAPYLLKAQPVLSLLPPGLPGRGLAGVAQGDSTALFGATALLLAYAAACGFLLRIRLRAQYLGEDLGESRAPSAPQRTAATAMARPRVAVPEAAGERSFLPPLISAPAAAVLRKEIRYIQRNSAMLMTLVLPIILIVFISLSMTSPRHGHANPFFVRMPDLAFPAGAAYMFLIFGQFAHNSFAYDGRGVQLYFLAPVRFREILLGKNLMLALEVVLETFLVWILISALKGPPAAIYLLGTCSWLLFALLVHFMIGNWLSLQFPRRFDFGQFRRRASGVTVLTGLILQVVLLGLGVLVGFIAFMSGRLWIFLAVFLVLSAMALWLYLASLDSFSRFAMARREVLMEQLVR